MKTKILFALFFALTFGMLAAAPCAPQVVAKKVVPVRREIRVSLIGENLARRPKGELNVQTMIDHWTKAMDREIGNKPDLVVLPEISDIWLGLSPQEKPIWLEQRGDAILRAFQAYAAQHRCYLVYPTYRSLGAGSYANAAIVIDREGDVVGIYDKFQPTVRDLGNPAMTVRPGTEALVLDTDFGRLGVMICFDLNFAGALDLYREAKPDVLVFPSYYDGGFFRQMWAATCESWVLASTVGRLSKSIVDPAGAQVCHEVAPVTTVTRTINTNARVIHWDFNDEKVASAKAKYGATLEVANSGDTQLALLSSKNADRPIDSILAEFGIEAWRDYRARSSAARTDRVNRFLIDDLLHRYVDAGRIAGVVSVLSTDDYRETYDCVGWADLENRVPMTPDTLFAVFSMTKTFTGAAIMCAIDDGMISLDDPVSKHLPEFADVRMENGAAPRRPLTVRDLTSHVNGFRGGARAVNRDIPIREVARRLAAQPLVTQPGEVFSYGTATIDAAAACLEVAVGKPYEVYLKERILDPLDMKDTTFNPTPEQVKRLVRAYSSDDRPLRPAADGFAEQLRFPKRHRVYPVPGGGLFSTPRDMVRFSQMLAHHGEWKGRRLISRKTFDEIFVVKQTPRGILNPYTCGSWLYGDWFGHEGAMRTDQRANLRTGQSRVFFIQTENKAGAAFFQLKKEWHEVADQIQGTPATVFGN